MHDQSGEGDNGDDRQELDDDEGKHALIDVDRLDPRTHLSRHLVLPLSFRCDGAQVEQREAERRQDSLVGIQAAKAAGMVALLYSPSPPDHPYAADVTFAKMEELTTIISSFEG